MRPLSRLAVSSVSSLVVSSVRVPTVVRVGVASPSSLGVGSVRWMGMMDSLRAATDKQKTASMEAKKQQVFTAQVAYMSQLDEYSMTAHNTQLQDTAKSLGVTGWRSKLRSGEKQRELENQFTDIKIGEALTESELEDPKSVNRRAKLRIATELGLDVAQVNRFLAGFEEMKTMHRWLRGRVKRGLALPASPDEYQKMVMADPSGTSRKRIQKQMGRVRGVRAMYNR